ncbi:MAG: HAMP domain-containing sensor histidine kinase [Phototrophicales bacterium]|nr:HAMP domain-containing sensor histidine kinase [Phototrophicales bacterium]
MSALEEAKQALTDLLDNARVGNIIPIRLPSQIEAIQATLLQAEKEHQDEIADLRRRPSGDIETVLQDNAEFMRVAIHDLKNPLASIKGYSDLLNNPAMGGELSPMQSQLLQVVRSNSKRMEALLEDMSIMNRLRNGVTKVNQKMDMFKNIAMVVDKKMRPLAEELNRQLEFDTPQGLPLLNVDGDLIAIIFNKLVENALRYSPEGTGKVVVRAWGSEGSLLIVEVQDNGVGMTPEEVARLGELFFRSDNEVIRAFKGSGLGIPIAYGLVDVLRGKITVESEPNIGTKFVVTLEGMS